MKTRRIEFFTESFAKTGSPFAVITFKCVCFVFTSQILSTKLEKILSAQNIKKPPNGLEVIAF